MVSGMSSRENHIAWHVECWMSCPKSCYEKAMHNNHDNSNCKIRIVNYKFSSMICGRIDWYLKIVDFKNSHSRFWNNKRKFQCDEK